MGGFEGGDEGGFWDIDMLDKERATASKYTKKSTSPIERSGSVYSIKAYADRNEHPSIGGQKEEKSILPSSSSSIQRQYDTISFVPEQCEIFTIESPDDTPIEESSIYKAYQAIIEYTADSDIEAFFHEHKVVVARGTASFDTLVSAASHAAAFILLLKELCNLILRHDELAKIGNTVDSDVASYIGNYL